ncbi:MAG: hypothetical protein ABFC34_11405 [Methanobacterium sp.]
MIIDGNNAYLVTTKENKSGMHLTEVYFTENGTPYLVVYASKTNDQQILNSLLNSLKIS